MIFMYIALSFLCGAMAARLLKHLPTKWLCDYGEGESEKHSKENRSMNAIQTLLFGAVCAAVQWAFSCFSANEGWLVNCSVALLVPVLLLVAFCDIKYTIIPNELLIVAALLGAPYAFSNGYIRPIMGAIIGSAVLFAVFFIAARLLKKEAMGFGDVLLSALCGYLCGAKGYIVVLFIAVFSAAFIFAILLIIKKIDKNEPQPFGPFLIGGIALTMCFWPFWQDMLQRFYGI